MTLVEDRDGGCKVGRGPLRFWYEFASTYSYIAASTVEREAVRHGIEVEWRPFLLGPIFVHQGWNDSPFNLYPTKGRYMWRDMARLCAREGVPWRQPSAFPRSGLLAARVALVGLDEGWGIAFSKAIFHANFADDRDIADLATVAEILDRLGQNPDAILARAGTTTIKTRLRDVTAEAEEIGIFGAPTFQVGAELFWGHDRLIHALEWAKSRDSEGAESPR